MIVADDTCEWKDRSGDDGDKIYSYDNGKFIIYIFRYKSLQESNKSKGYDTEFELSHSGHNSLAQLMKGVLDVESPNDCFCRIEAHFKEGKFVDGYSVNINLKKDSDNGEINDLKDLSGLEDAIGEYFLQGNSFDGIRAIFYKSELPGYYREGIKELLERKYSFQENLK